MLFIKHNKILLVKRKGELFHGYWALPGGHIEYGQSAEETVRREAREETGLKVISQQFINLYTDPNRSPDEGITASYLVTFEGEPVAGDDAGEIRFFDLDKLPLPLAFDHEKLIKDYLEKDIKYSI